MTRLGKHEKAILKFCWDVGTSAPGARPCDYRRHEWLWEDAYNDLLSGELLPIALVRKHTHVPHRSTMTRSLATLDEKGLINRKMIEGHCLWDTKYSAGTYTKYIELTHEGQRVAQTLTNENVKC